MSAAIAAANDCFRAYPETGLVLTTAGVDALGPDFQLAALDAVKRFDGFSNEDDPYGNHDFGIVFARFGVSLDESSVGREVKRMGYAKLSARPRHHQQDPAALTAFKETSPPA